jgi:hypothetical protein
MNTGETAEDLATWEQERQAMPLCAVDAEAMLLLVNQGSRIPCRVVELGLTGCRVSSIKQIAAGIQARVEVAFKIRGIAFRFSGVTRWNDDRTTVGIHFGEMPVRRRDDLVEVLCEVEQENAAKAEKQAAEMKAAEELATANQTAGSLPVESPVPKQAEDRALNQLSVRPDPAQPVLAPRVLPISPSVRRPEPAPNRTVVRDADALLDNLFPIRKQVAGRLQPAVPNQTEPNPAARPPAKPNKRERRIQARHEVDTEAVIHLIHVASRLNGRIIDLSLSGCRIRTNERFPVGIYTRVETEFQLEGLPFRLGGVIQSIHNRNLVGIRFLDLSERKLEQLKQLIVEIEEMRASEMPAETKS